MLDLSKPLGQIEGLTLYGDHEQPDLVYYLPDEVDLRDLAPDRPDISLQVFFPDEAVTGAGGLDKAVGSILSLGVQCRLSTTREAAVRAAALERLGRDSIRLSPPPWEDGTVDLLLLDTQGQPSAAPTPTDDRLVLNIVGSRRPSLSDGLLSGLFHARLDRRGTALVAAAIRGEAGSLAGVLYDLKYAALRPTVDLRMSADLNRCAEFFKTGVGVQVYYVSADIQATFGKMREQGVIKVDLVSQASDPESEKLVNESVKDFYDVLMRELFKPTVSPAEVLGAAGVPTMQASIVKFSFAYTRVDHERIVEVDYRKRSATRRTHNPQAHLRRLAALGGGAERIVQRVPLSSAWREFEVEIAAPDAFADASLRQVRVVLWRGRDAELPASEARDGGLRLPATAAPLADLALTKGDAGPKRLSFVTMPDEPPFYRWQARLTYAPADGVDSPAELWSEPHVSSSADLDLFPEVLAPRHETVLRFGAGHREPPVAIEAHLVARAADGQAVAERRVSVDSTRPEARWSVRRTEAQRVTAEGALTYRYENGASLTRPPRTLIDREVFANDPFFKVVTIAPLVVAAPADLLEVVLTASYRDEESGYTREVRRRLQPPDFKAEDVKVPTLRAEDVVEWSALAVRANGETIDLGRGTTPGGVLTLKFAQTRRIRVEWLGPTPADLGLRWVKATFRARAENGEALETASLEWRGQDVNGERVVTLPLTGRAEWSIEKRFEDGRKETTPFVAVDGDLLGVSG